MIYLQLFWEFFKTGLFAIGGGMATIPFLYEMSDKTGWFSHADLEIMVAVGESTPGPIGVNMATYVGFLTGMRDAGWLTAILGAVTATLGLITPSVIVILIVAALAYRDPAVTLRAVSPHGSLAIIAVDHVRFEAAVTHDLTVKFVLVVLVQ